MKKTNMELAKSIGKAFTVGTPSESTYKDMHELKTRAVNKMGDVTRKALTNVEKGMNNFRVHKSKTLSAKYEPTANGFAEFVNKNSWSDARGPAALRKMMTRFQNTHKFSDKARRIMWYVWQGRIPTDDPSGMRLLTKAERKELSKMYPDELEKLSLDDLNSGDDMKNSRLVESFIKEKLSEGGPRKHIKKDASAAFVKEVLAIKDPEQRKAEFDKVMSTIHDANQKAAEKAAKAQVAAEQVVDAVEDVKEALQESTRSIYGLKWSELSDDEKKKALDIFCQEQHGYLDIAWECLMEDLQMTFEEITQKAREDGVKIDPKKIYWDSGSQGWRFESKPNVDFDEVSDGNTEACIVGFIYDYRSGGITGGVEIEVDINDEDYSETETFTGDKDGNIKFEGISEQLRLLLQNQVNAAYAAIESIINAITKHDNGDGLEVIMTDLIESNDEVVPTPSSEYYDYED